MIGAYPGLWYGVHLSRHPRDRNPSVCRATYAMSLRLAPAVNRFIFVNLFDSIRNVSPWAIFTPRNTFAARVYA